MALYGSIATVRAQVAPSAGFTAAFSYLDELLRDGSEAAKRIRGIPVGEVKKIELAGGAIAIEQVYETKPRAEGFFESHRKYIDVQVVVVGEEAMELSDISRIKVKQPYQEDRDVIIYADAADASLLRVYPGQAAIFFPNDVHMPQMQTSGKPVLVRKTVVKVPVA